MAPRLSGHNCKFSNLFVSQFPKETCIQRKQHQIETFVLKTAEPCYNIDISNVAHWCFHGLTLLHRNNSLNLSGHEYFKGIRQQTYQMISHSLVSGQSNIQPPSQGPFQSGLPGVAMKESRLKMSPRLKLFPPVEHHWTWTYNQEGTLLMANLPLLRKEIKKSWDLREYLEGSYTVDVRFFE